jgi:hypothetical protein
MLQQEELRSEPEVGSAQRRNDGLRRVLYTAGQVAPCVGRCPPATGKVPVQHLVPEQYLGACPLALRADRARKVRQVNASFLDVR